MKKKINIIIQARLQSSRLKKKIILEINQKPLFFYIIERIKKIPGINKIILSTSNYSKNLELIEYSRNLGIDVYHEDTMHENDLCSRFYNTCKKFPCDAFVKINGDCPIPEINIIKRVISIYKKDNTVDYISNKKDSWPLGYSVELIGFKCLSWYSKNLKSAIDREFFATKISNNKDKFKLIFIPNKLKFKFTGHLMVDTFDDFRIIRRIYEELYLKKNNFNLKDLENFFKINKINT